MAQRPLIGLPFNYDENWIGGVYYIKNVLSALALLPPAQQPDVRVVCHEEKSWAFLADASHYPRLSWQTPASLAPAATVPARIRWRLERLVPAIFGRRGDFDVIFPSPLSAADDRTVCWIPDFQDKHLPEYFSADELKAREDQHRLYFTHFRHVLFSSHAAREDFERFYPEARVNRHVVHFAVFNRPATSDATDDVRAVYQLPAHFAYCPNQFWVHKDHATAIRAIAALRERGHELTLVCSGKEHDHRVPDHPASLRRLADELGVAAQIRFVGFVSKAHQEALLREAALIVQPSRFEGWSTTVEDAKSISQYVVASDIAPHREQLDCNARFFKTGDPLALADALEPFASQAPARQTIDYSINQRRFADEFIAMVHAVIDSRRRA